jgi:hypothetical protein
LRGHKAARSLIRTAQFKAQRAPAPLAPRALHPGEGDADQPLFAPGGGGHGHRLPSRRQRQTAAQLLLVGRVDVGPLAKVDGGDQRGIGVERHGAPLPSRKAAVAEATDPAWGAP